MTSAPISSRFLESEPVTVFFYASVEYGFMDLKSDSSEAGGGLVCIAHCNVEVK